MDVTSSRTDTESVVGEALDRWKTAVDAHEPEQVAAGFTQDAIFQGMHPYSVGRPGVAEYYASQPLGMTAAYRVLETRQPADGLVLGFAHVTFSFTDREPLPVYLVVLLERAADGDWYISHYQVSHLG